MSLNFGLEDIHVLVTGASGDIGFETVKVLKQLGARVTAHYHTSPKELINTSGVVSIQANVRDYASILSLFEQAAERNGGPVSVLVLNHGIWPMAPVELVNMSLKQWNHTLSVNLTGPFLLCQTYLWQLFTAPDNVKATASIIFIGSTAGKFGEANHADYSASKSAVMYGLVPTLKNEIVAIAPKARVNSVNPGWVETPMADQTLKDEKKMERALATTPLQKFAQPADVARQVAVLASPVLSGHVSGMNVMVDGGMEGRILFPPKN